jgi:hypothetical protein
MGHIPKTMTKRYNITIQPEHESRKYDTLVTILTNENKQRISPETPQKCPQNRISVFQAPRVIKTRLANLIPKLLILFTISKQLKI